MINTIREYLERVEESQEHINKYIANIKKEVGDKRCIVGHLHKYVNRDNIEVMDTYIRGFKAINGNTLILSDLHITNESDNDYLLEIKEILEDYVNSYFHVILLGDVFDLWISDGNKMKCNKLICEIVDLINNNKNSIVYIKGNHDWEIEKYFDVICYEDIVINDIIYFHGHQFDDFYKDTIIGKIFLQIQLYFGDNLHKFNKWLKKTFYHGE